MRRCSLLAILCIVSSPPLARVLAQLPQTRLNSVFPTGGRLNGTVEVAISGDFTDAATELVFSHPDITATQQIEGPSEYRAAHRRQRNFDVRIGPEVPTGTYEVRAVGSAGLSNPRRFVVSDLEQAVFAADGNSAEHPFEVTVGQVVDGRARPDQRDYYRVTAAQGDPLLIQVWAERIDSLMDAALVVYDAEGKRCGRAIRGLTLDPVFEFTPAADGDYLIEVAEQTFRGGDEYFYRLEVSQRAQVDAVFPPVAPFDQESTFTVYGFNLPGGVPISQTTHLGNLQSLSLTFTPGEQPPVDLAGGLQRGELAAVTVPGAALRLPEPLRDANPVFLAKASLPVVLETEQSGNDTQQQAQALPTPCEVAGQFYPRRDVDWFEFEARKGQTLWIDLKSQRLGASADPVLRIVKKKVGDDGQSRYQDVSRVDDLEGRPRSRESRRFFSGTNDVSFAFNADEDATYAVSVTDLYNAAYDDPRLVYSLAIRPRTPDFELLAFAEPDRHGDEKIAKPTGVSILPGGAQVVRVRLVPQDGFGGTVEVSARDLPASVTAWPLQLGPQLPEGLLVLAAAADAAPLTTTMRIVGETIVDGRTVERIAHPAAIRHGSNNIDGEPTDVRLVGGELTISVVDSDGPPARFWPAQETAVMSVGGKLDVPVRVARRDGYGDELELSAVQVPKGVKVAGAKTKEQTVEVALTLDDKNLPAGRYSFPLTAKVKEKRPRNKIVVREATADLEKIQKVLAQRDAELTLRDAKLGELTAEEKALGEKIEQSRQEVAAAQSRLAKNLQSSHETAANLLQELTAAAADLGNATLQTPIEQTEAELRTLQLQRAQLVEDLAAAQQPLRETTSTFGARVAQREALQTEVDALRAKRDEAEQQRQEAEKRLAEAKKTQLEQDHEFWIYSTPVQLEVKPTPVEVLWSAPSYQLRAGEEVAIPILVRREFGFAGQVTVNVKTPPGIAATSLVLGPGQDHAKLVLQAAADLGSGDWDVAVRTSVNFNGMEITHEQAGRIALAAAAP